jgi:hypothetical protein
MVTKAVVCAFETTVYKVPESVLIIFLGNNFSERHIIIFITSSTDAKEKFCTSSSVLVYIIVIYIVVAIVVTLLNFIYTS